MMEKVSTGVNLIPKMVVMIALTTTATINPVDSGKGLFWS
jgi:hypothetical protein